MPWFYTLPLRLRALFRRRQLDQELDEELRYHIEQQIQEHVAKGMTRERARTLVLRGFGGMERRKEECRDMRRMNVLENLWKDLSHAAHVLRRSPGFTTLAVVTLGLGIGANTSIFSVVYGVLLKPLPFHEPDRLVDVSHRGFNHGPATYFTYRENQRVLEDMGVWDANDVSLTGAREPERVQALTVTAATLPLLRVQPILGRGFRKEDDAPGSPRRVILTYGYWQRRFGGAEDVIGQPLDIDGTPTEIIGVLPAAFTFLDTDPTVLLPERLDRAGAFGGVQFEFQLLARLKPGATIAQANADVARMISLLPDAFDVLRLRPNVRPLIQDVTGDIGHVLWNLLATVGIVLLIACANVANLFLVRAEGRQQELAVRAALGASRTRIARELLAESLMLGLAGGAVGLLLARVGIAVLKRLAPAELPRVDEIALDPIVLVFTLGISIVTGLLFGLIPILRFGKPNTAALKEGGRLATDAPGRHRARNTLVVAEVALALVLLVVSGLMIRTVVALRQVDPGFVDPEEVQTFRIDVPEALVKDPVQMVRTHEQIAEQLRHVPGVVSVGLSSSITMDGENNMNPIYIEDAPVPDGELPPFRRLKSVAPGYFRTMGNPVVAGRDITWTDIYQARRVVVISETLAGEYWEEPSRALGKRIRFDDPDWQEVVGVVGNEHDDGLHQPSTAIVYWPIMNDYYMQRTMAYAVRSTRVGAPGFLRELQQAVWSVNSNLPLANVQTLDEIQDDSMAQTSSVMVMLAIAATVALLLGVVGIYGVIAYVAAQRTREIGIRMALGAQTGDVRRLFLRHGLGLTLTGIALGVGAALLLTRVMSALLFGVSPTDPITYAGVAAGLAAVALVATYLPARRASRIDPIIALRSDM